MTINTVRHDVRLLYHQLGISKAHEIDLEAIAYYIPVVIQDAGI